MPGLTAGERTTLLRLARASLEEALGARGSVDRAVESVALTSALQEIRGAFVTLRDRAHPEEDGTPALRGCIGTLEAREPLFESVIHNASHAALNDPRFPPVRAAEIPWLSVEISCLTPMRPVPGPEGIVPGLHGVHLEKGAGHRAVFLPQVATEQGWDTATLLHHLARKAGIVSGEWAGASLSVFEAEVFGEDESGAA